MPFLKRHNTERILNFVDAIRDIVMVGFLDYGWYLVGLGLAFILALTLWLIGK